MWSMSRRVHARWEVTIVILPALSRCSSAKICCSASASIAEVGSSRIQMPGVAQVNPGEGEPLPLSTGEADPFELWAELGVEAVGQSTDEVAYVRGIQGRPDLLVADRLGSTEPDAVANGELVATELLGQQAEVAEATTRRKRRGVHGVDLDSSVVEVDDAEQGVDRCGLTGAVHTNQRDHRANLNVQVESAQRRPVLVRIDDGNLGRREPLGNVRHMLTCRIALSVDVGEQRAVGLDFGHRRDQLAVGVPGYACGRSSGDDSQDASGDPGAASAADHDAHQRTSEEHSGCGPAKGGSPS